MCLVTLVVYLSPQGTRRAQLEVAKSYLFSTADLKVGHRFSACSMSNTVTTVSVRVNNGL